MSGPEPLAAAGFAATINVSRETIERLERYAALLIKWNKTVNLVGRSTIADLWRRHMLDSAQLFPYLPKSAGRLVDFGSGAGFPGLVLAIMGAPDVHLVEANARKCAFLREAARVTETAVTIHNARIETPTALKADVVTARALAPLSILLEYAEPYLTPNSICLFLKGTGVDEELTEIQKMWNIRENTYPSLSNPDGVIVRLEVLSHDSAG